MNELPDWPNSYRVWDPYWGFTTIMTTGDPAVALAITVHSYTASDMEILTTECVACYLVAGIAWRNDDIRKDFENTRASALSQQDLQRHMKDDTECGSKSALPQLTIRIISIHGRNIRVLNTTFTEHYFKSLSKAGQKGSSNLHFCINSFPALGYGDTEISHLAQKLMINT